MDTSDPLARPLAATPGLERPESLQARAIPTGIATV